jgi:transcriptional regulator with XRE-family HTH domain
MKNHKEHLAARMKDPRFAKAWDDAALELDVKRALIEARMANGWTQKDLADRCGMRQSNISRLESGATSPTLRTLQQLAQGLGKRIEVKIVQQEVIDDAG